MKNRLLIISFLVLVPILGYSQEATIDATQNALTIQQNSLIAQQSAEQKVQSGLLNTLSGTIVSMEKMEKNYQKLLNDAEWLKNLKSAKQLYILIESVYCTYKDLQILGMRSGLFGNCLFSARYQIATVNLQNAIDMASLTLANGRSMSSGERLKSLNDAIQSFQTAHLMFGQLTGMSNNVLAISAQRTQMQSSRNNLLKLRTY